ncbi:zinc-binding alcohol dehydrogenase family protein [Alteribacillus sp. HJP-4]|uniref:zinc-binding alcohol dehydrogenase family protein n=1 Tax=Alteribacillus sp. HJP-4 TaxID=2775394 RepID=UPI0035CCE37B
MKTIVCQKPNQFEMIETDKPAAQSGEVLVEIKRIGICGTDLHAYKGNQPFFQYPRVLGHELSGVVLDPNNDNDLRKGDRVSIIPYVACGKCPACRKGKTNCCEQLEVIGVHRDGGMSEIISVPAGNIIKTNDISLEEAALLEPLSIGAHAVERGQLEEDQSVLVIGGGPIGLGVIAFAKQNGNKVIALDINEERLRFCKTWGGADETVAISNNTMENIKEVNHGELPEIVFDATGNKQSMMNAFDYVSHGGKLIYVGLVKENITFFDPDFHKKELTLMGSRNARKEDFRRVKQAIASKDLVLEPYITHKTSFAQLIDDYESWYDPAENVIKAMVTV